MGIFPLQSFQISQHHVTTQGQLCCRGDIKWCEEVLGGKQKQNWRIKPEQLGSHRQHGLCAVHTCNYPQPIQTCNYPQPIQTCNYPQPMQTCNYPQPMQTCNYPQPIQTCNYPQPIQTCNNRICNLCKHAIIVCKKKTKKFNSKKPSLRLTHES